MKKHMAKLAVALLLATSGAVYAMPILDIQGGQLFGASGIDVGGSLYDVEFVDGTCIGLFSGCDDLTDFTFQTQFETTLASQALLDQVFLGIFDTEPSLTNGCDPWFVCEVLTPFAFTVNDRILVMDTQNYRNGRTQDNVAGPVSASRAYNTGGGDIFIETVYARWTDHEVTAVPEPSSLAVLALGLLVLGLSHRRHQH